MQVSGRNGRRDKFLGWTADAQPEGKQGHRGALHTVLLHVSYSYESSWFDKKLHESCSHIMILCTALIWLLMTSDSRQNSAICGCECAIVCKFDKIMNLHIDE